MNRKLIVGAGFLLFVMAGLLAFIFWPTYDDSLKQDISTAPQELTLLPPAPTFKSFTEAKTDEELTISLANDGPRWLTASGEELLQGPTLPDDRQWQWTIHETQGWTVATGLHRHQDLEILAKLWSAPNMGMAIIDLEASIPQELIESPLSIFTSFPTKRARAKLLTAELITKTRAELTPLDTILASRFDRKSTSAHIFSPASAAGKIRPHSDSQSTQIAWELWPGLDTDNLCPPEGDEKQELITTKLRLILQLGPQALLIPAPSPTLNDTKALTTPIFIEPPHVSANAWSDGRSRDSRELARRIRALSFGHSNPEDPRYGNGGFLAHHMGATFAIPQKWWDEEPILDLKHELQDTPIGLIPQNSLDSSITSSPLSLTSAEQACIPPSTLQKNTPLLSLDPEVTSPQIFAIAQALPPVIPLGKSTSERARLFAHLLGDPEQALSSISGTYNLQVFPLIATRNPLEPIAEQALLSPERNGHWTLHDSLTRALSRWELEQQSAPPQQSMSIQTLLAHRELHRQAFALFTPPESVEYHPPQEPLHFLLFDRNGSLSSLHTEEPTPTLNESPPRINLRFTHP